MQPVCCGIFKYCLRGMLGDTQRETLFFFLDTIKLACSEGITTSLAETIDERSLALLERDFPMSIQVSVIHNIMVDKLLLALSLN